MGACACAFRPGPWVDPEPPHSPCMHGMTCFGKAPLPRAALFTSLINFTRFPFFTCLHTFSFLPADEYLRPTNIGSFKLLDYHLMDRIVRDAYRWAVLPRYCRAAVPQQVVLILPGTSCSPQALHGYTACMQYMHTTCVYEAYMSRVAGMISWQPWANRAHVVNARRPVHMPTGTRSTGSSSPPPSPASPPSLSSSRAGPAWAPPPPP